jgi:hypothetical protein
MEGITIPFFKFTLIAPMESATHFDTAAITEEVKQMHQKTPCVALCPFAGHMLHTKTTRLPKIVGAALFTSNCLGFTK